MQHRYSSPAQMALMGMFSTADVIDKARGDAVAVADARTSMCDYRLAYAQSLGKRCDRDGYTRPWEDRCRPRPSTTARGKPVSRPGRSHQ